MLAPMSLLKLQSIPNAWELIDLHQPRCCSDSEHHALREQRLMVVADHVEAECRQMWQDGVLPLNDVVAPKHDACCARALECPVQDQRPQVLHVCDACEHEVQDVHVHGVEVHELPDRRGLECRVPGVVAQEVCTGGRCMSVPWFWLSTVHTSCMLAKLSSSLVHSLNLWRSQKPAMPLALKYQPLHVCHQCRSG